MSHGGRQAGPDDAERHRADATAGLKLKQLKQGRLYFLSLFSQHIFNTFLICLFVRFLFIISFFFK